jgi:hypothetical protein
LVRRTDIAGPNRTPLRIKPQSVKVTEDGVKSSFNVGADVFQQYVAWSYDPNSFSDPRPNVTLILNPFP